MIRAGLPELANGSVGICSSSTSRAYSSLGTLW
jgi:hypothetical protein